MHLKLRKSNGRRGAQSHVIWVIRDHRAPSGHITLDIRVILASLFGPICGDDHPYITRYVPDARPPLPPGPCRARPRGGCGQPSGVTWHGSDSSAGHRHWPRDTAGLSPGFGRGFRVAEGSSLQPRPISRTRRLLRGPTARDGERAPRYYSRGFSLGGCGDAYRGAAKVSPEPAMGLGWGLIPVGQCRSAGDRREVTESD
jgi:hypothetical protein